MTKHVIGLLGGIGSGKSQVAAMLARHGARIINADVLGHEALRETEIKQAIVTRWGKELLDEKAEIVRKRLAAIIFADAQERRALEALVHPWIAQQIQKAIALAQNDSTVPFIVLDAAIMLEAGWHEVCTKKVFVDAPREVRLERLRSRGWSEGDLADRERAQLPLTEKVSCADHVLENSTSLDNLERQVNELVALLVGRTPATNRGNLASGEGCPS